MEALVKQLQLPLLGATLSRFELILLVRETKRTLANDVFHRPIA